MDYRFIRVDELRPGDVIVSHSQFVDKHPCKMFITTIEDEPEEYENVAGVPMFIFRCSSIIGAQGQLTPYKDATDRVPDNHILLSTEGMVLLLRRRC
jgi:hypothetical protein